MTMCAIRLLWVVPLDADAAGRAPWSKGRWAMPLGPELGRLSVGGGG